MRLEKLRKLAHMLLKISYSDPAAMVFMVAFACLTCSLPILLLFKR